MKIDFKNKKIWLAVFLVLITPFFLNLFLFQFTTTLTYKGDWLTFWGNYSGGLISAFVAYIVANSQIEKKLKFDLAKEEYNKVINQLPALIRIEIEFKRITKELTRVKKDRDELVIKADLTESRLNDKVYNVGLLDTDILKFIERVENIDLQIELIMSFNFYKDFSKGLLFNVAVAERKEKKLFDIAHAEAKERNVSEVQDLNGIENLLLIQKELNEAYEKKKKGWEAIYQQDKLSSFEAIQEKIALEIDSVKKIKESQGANLNWLIK